MSSAKEVRNVVLAIVRNKATKPVRHIDIYIGDHHRSAIAIAIAIGIAIAIAISIA
jgi:hypothetical protein